MPNPFKLKDRKYYKDRKGRLYGPLKFNVSAFGEVNNYFTSPGHTLTWSEDGLLRTSARVFMGNERDTSFDLIERFRVRK